MMRSLLEITRHELAVALRTKRALVVAGIYLAAAALGGTSVIMSVRFLEKQAMERLIGQGMSPAQAAAALSLLGDQGYNKLFALFAGVPADQLAASFSASVIVPFLFWGSLAFLPFLVLLTSFDQVAADVQSRTICYSTLRASRTVILLGKLAAQAILFVGVTALCAGALVALAAGLLSTFSWTEIGPGLVRMALLLLPFGLCYLAIAAFTSASVRQPFSALVAAMGVILGLWVLGKLQYVPPDHPLGFLRTLRWLSPSSYQSGLWLEGSWRPLASAAAYLAFAAAFVLLAVRQLGRRDL